MRRYRAYEDLFEILRGSQDDDAALVTRRIRSGEDVESLVRSIREGDLLLQLAVRPEWKRQYEFPGRFQQMPPHLNRWPNPYLKSKSLGRLLAGQEDTHQKDEVREVDRMYAVPYHAVKLADPRLESIDLTKYTTVIKNKSLLRSLLEIYLLFEYPFDSFFHADLFLDDIVRGQNRHCSPLLIHAVLAAGWVRCGS